MLEALAMLVTLKSLLARQTPAVPEPEFKPFKFAEDAVRPTSVTVGPRTLRELGIDGALAREMEHALWLHGHTKGDQVVGYSFRTPDGISYALKLSSVPVEGLAKRAA